MPPQKQRKPADATAVQPAAFGPMLDHKRSQLAQDWVVRAIFSHVKPRNRQYVEIGFNTNEQCATNTSGSNTCRLWLAGWSGLLLDGAHSNATINLHSEFVTSANIVPLLRKYKVPRDVDFMSIDVDSYEMWLLEAILKSEYKPGVVAVEYNSNFPWRFTLAYPDPYQFKTRYSSDRLQHTAKGGYTGGCYSGAAPRAIALMARKHGYVALAAVVPLDLILVKAELAAVARHALNSTHFNKRETVGRWLIDDPGRHAELRDGWMLNTYGNRTMTAAQALELVDWVEWERQRARGATADYAAKAARASALPQLEELSCIFRLNNMRQGKCFARLQGALPGLKGNCEQFATYRNRSAWWPSVRNSDFPGTSRVVASNGLRNVPLHQLNVF